MVRLTPELIEDSYQYMNPIKEYELSLRGYKIGLIENLGATLNQFDTIDFTDNDIRRLDGFPALSKLKSLLFSNNKVQHIGSNLEQFLPKLENLVLVNNNIEDLGEIDQLATIKTLKSLSLVRNPVAALKHYRLYTIYRIPSLRNLDFKKVKEKERQEAQKLYKGKKLKRAEKPKTFIPGEQLDRLSLTNVSNTGFSGPPQHQHAHHQQKQQASKEDLDAIRFAITQAKSIEEIEQLNNMLRSGIVPSHLKQQQQQQQQFQQHKRPRHDDQMIEEDE